MTIQNKTKEKYAQFISHLALHRGTKVTFEDMKQTAKRYAVTFVLPTAMSDLGFLSVVDKQTYLIADHLTADAQTVNRILKHYAKKVDMYTAASEAKKHKNGQTALAIPDTTSTEILSLLKKIAERLGIK